ncbi:oxidoreductase [Variovorax sp. ZS18.2.2]|uniref:oxidoreductase n=1 Tax=Variovorax sp. ZS18.2.2 TaxID=2971255 RepID=UPI002150EF25|nr:oxidoreductase [Variovorax sp. ZS18.2.2]MCR6476512.1 oxidoreductase [Variovorax sp. ZS18.2.2]
MLTSSENWLPSGSNGLKSLFEGFQLQGKYFRNRVWVPPMCQYAAPQGAPTAWHERHYATLAISSGCVVVEATAISSVGRVTPEDLVLDDVSLLPAHQRLVDGIRRAGAVPGIQLCHAGRKGSRSSPWRGDLSLSVKEGGWPILGPSAIAFGENYAVPGEMTLGDIQQTIRQFVESAQLAERAGYEVIEVHGGHGRLVHSLLSPISNLRTDSYGGSFENRCLYAVELARTLRSALRADTILAFRLSCVDWVNNGIALEDSVQLSRLLGIEGVALIDCSSGGIVSPILKKTHPGYQVQFSNAIKVGAGIATAAVGEIFTIELSESILESAQADVIMMGRRSLIDPTYLMRCAALAGYWDLVPLPYRRAMERLLRAEIQLVPEL